MSRSTPRKNRQHHNRHQSGQRIGATSDYESDAALYMESRPEPNPQLLNRTNTDLNLSVLQRYLPSISATLSIAASAVVYTFDPASQEWDKPGVEGTLFVCSQEPSPAAPSVPRACVFVLNRHGLNNLILDLAKVADFEATEQLLTFRLVESGGGSGGSGGDSDGAGLPGQKIIGLWIHNDEEHTRAVNAAVIQEACRQVQAASRRSSASNAQIPEESMGPAMQAMGRKLSISDLFRRQKNGAGGA